MCDQIKKYPMGGPYSTHRRNKNCIQNVIRTSEEWRPLRRTGYIFDNNIKLDRRDKGCDDMDWTYLAKDRGPATEISDMISNLQVP
jgi:hypothetical protein